MTCQNEIEKTDIFCLYTPLRKLIQDYLQYEEASKIFEYLTQISPQRPIFHLDQSNLFSKLDETKEWRTGHNCYYIEHKDGVRISRDHLKNFYKLDKYYKFYWRCLLCKVWNLFQFIDLSYGPFKDPYIKIWTIHNFGDYFNSSLCRWVMDSDKLSRVDGEGMPITNVNANIESTD